MTLTSKTFANLITFTRTTTATYVDSAGVLQTAASGSARFDHDPVTLEAKGLLIEAAATNLLLRSEEFDNASWTKDGSSITANDISAPDGAATMDKIVEDSGTSEHRVYQGYTVTSGTDYTLSVFAKADERSRIKLTSASGVIMDAVFDLSTGSIVSADNGTAQMQNLGGGIYRCSVTQQATSSVATNLQVRMINSGVTTSYTGDGSSGLHVWGAQLEVGLSATSYIPTTTATATRNADAALITGTAFSDWFNATEGTIFIEGTLPLDRDSPSGNYYFSISDGTFNEAIVVADVSGVRGIVWDGGVAQATLQSSEVLNAKIAMAFKVNDIAMCVNGGTVLTDTSATLPTVDQMALGRDPAGTASTYMSGHIKAVRFYPSRLTDAELQEITA